MNIVIAYLSSGQVIVAKRAMEDGQVVLQDPFELLVSPTQHGGLQASLMPFGTLFGALPPIKVLHRFDTLTDLVDAPKAIEDQYLQASSGLILK